MTVPILSEYQVVNLAVSKIDERVEYIKEELVKGTCKNYEAYANLTGQVRGLYEARYELLDALKKVEV